MVLAVLVLNLCKSGRLLRMARTEMGGVKGLREASSEEDETKGNSSEDVYS